MGTVLMASFGAKGAKGTVLMATLNHKKCPQRTLGFNNPRVLCVVHRCQVQCLTLVPVTAFLYIFTAIGFLFSNV
jgi:hypothetical protein